MEWPQETGLRCFVLLLQSCPIHRARHRRFLTRISGNKPSFMAKEEMVGRSHMQRHEPLWAAEGKDGSMYCDLPHTTDLGCRFMLQGTRVLGTENGRLGVGWEKRPDVVRCQYLKKNTFFYFKIKFRLCLLGKEGEKPQGSMLLRFHWWIGLGPGSPVPLPVGQH